MDDFLRHDYASVANLLQTEIRITNPTHKETGGLPRRMICLWCCNRDIQAICLRRRAAMPPTKPTPTSIMP